MISSTQLKDKPMNREDLTTNASLPIKKLKFENKFNFINFQKSTPTENDPKTTNSDQESVANFYKNLIESDESKSAPQKSASSPTRIQPVSTQTRRPEFKYSQKLMFKSAQENDLDYVHLCVDNAREKILATDDFKWNILMIAVASFSNRVVDYLLKSLPDGSTAKELVNNRDLSGNDAECLARRVNNQQALEMIESFKKNAHGKQTHLAGDESTSAQPTNEQFHCDVCNETFNKSKADHEKSIVHQLNESSRDGVKKSHYFLRSNNKGYEIMVKGGWNENTGLGVNEQGRVNPIKTRLKLDRHGLGVEQNGSERHHYIHKPKILKLQQQPSTDSKSKLSLKQPPRKLKNEKKLKKFERDFRLYFDN